MVIDYSAIGRRIRERRMQLNLKQDEVAGLADISIVHYGNIENAKTKLSVEILMKICAVLDVTPDYILIGCEREIDKNYSKKFTDMLTLCKEDDLATIMDILAAFSKRQ